MNASLLWLWSPQWTAVVQALLHSLWQAGALALLLGLIFRSQNNPIRRHQLALGALALLLVASLVTWAILDARLHPAPFVSERNTSSATGPGPAAGSVTPVPATQIDPGQTTRGSAPISTLPWNAWLALAWLAGFSVMLVRASVQVAQADRLRRSGRPLDDPLVIALLDESRRAMGLAKEVRLMVTDTLTSPAVMGVIIPVLILPGALLTSLTPEQLRFIFLHELAHIRRGDYLANLFQQLIEALYFFNPAVWWISHLVRREREAACDILATESIGAPVAYARTLIQVAEASLGALGSAAQALGGDSKPSSLAERVQRLLVPGYRPTLRLTWRGLFGAMLIGGALLILSAVGTRLTIAAIVSPKERMDRIEQKMTAYGHPPTIAISTKDGTDDLEVPKARVTGRVVTDRPEALQDIQWVNFYHVRRGYNGIVSHRPTADGTFSDEAPLGQVCVGLNVPGYAPTTSPWIEVTGTNLIENLEVVLTRGFDTMVEVTAQDTGRPIAGALIQVGTWLRRHGGMSIGMPVQFKTDGFGRLRLEHCSDSVALKLIINAPGFQITEREFEQLAPGKTLRLELRRGRLVSGVVSSRVYNGPVAGATVRIIHETGRDTRHYEWTDVTRALGVTDSNGRFTTSQLTPGVRYWLGIGAPGHEAVLIEVPDPLNEVTASLGPALIVRGEVRGDLDQLQLVDRHRCLSRNFSERMGDASYGFQEWVPLEITNGVGYFQFTNRTAGHVTVIGAGYREEREVVGPIEDWRVDLRRRAEPATEWPTREVVFRFKHPSGLAPRGTVSVLLPDKLDPAKRISHQTTLEITNGEVRADIVVGGFTILEPRRTVGFWFKGPNHILVTNGPGPMVVDIPCIDAGAIFVKARHQDGSPIEETFFGVMELFQEATKERVGVDKLRAGQTPVHVRSAGELGEDLSKWASGPLPLGRTYQAYVRSKNAFAVKGPFRLIEDSPDLELEFSIPTGQNFRGILLDADGRPVADAKLDTSFSLTPYHHFGLNPVITDERGEFRLEGTTPEAGNYFVDANAPGMRAEHVQLDFESPVQTIRLQRGLTLGGQAMNAETGHPIAGMEIRAMTSGAPTLSTVTDRHGHFVFTSLSDGKYQFYIDEGRLVSDRQFPADGRTNLLLTVSLYEWSKLKRKH